MLGLQLGNAGLSPEQRWQEPPPRRGDGRCISHGGHRVRMPAIGASIARVDEITMRSSADRAQRLAQPEASI
jgi:hypothetical protein